MIDTIIKGAIAAGAAAAAWYADKYVKKKTGKHIHERQVHLKRVNHTVYHRPDNGHGVLDGNLG